MFDDDAYDLDKGQPRWVVRVSESEADYYILDIESTVYLNAPYSKQEDAAEVCAILNQYEAEIAELQAKLGRGHNGVSPNGH